ncbi:MAG: T9SS type A sorting domain-containing protein [Chitinophagales bacterium]|nr:T9SS type A sorting domain-containing protein [Chitinophagales bacterium]
MQKVLYLLLWIIPLSVFGQNRLTVEINLDSIGREIHYDAMGVNVERMHYRTLDENGVMPEEIFQDMMYAEDLIYRWPGGATANFYHFFNGTSKGYGLLREEVENVDHPMKCNLPKGSEYCMSFEATTPRNYIYDMLDFADRYQEIYNKKKKIVWLPNIFTFYLHNKQEIHQLDKISSLAEAEQLMENGEITADFYMRIKDIADVFNILIHHPSIELDGIEYGNEFYFHQPTTGEKYNEVNNGLAWLLNEKKYRSSLLTHISYYKSIIRFFNNILVKDGKTLPTAVPIGVITAEGKQQNMNLLWNEGIRDSILPLVDGIIHHLYFKAGGDLKVDPLISENPENANNLRDVKETTDLFIHKKIPAIEKQYEAFFNMKQNGKQMWLTEYNTDNGFAYGFFAQWQNTFFHAATQVEAFIEFVDNINNSDFVKFAFPHLWVSHRDDYNYGAYASKVELNGDYDKIKRTTYSAYAILGNLARKKLYQLKGMASNTKNLERMDLFTKTYFEPTSSQSGENLGNLILVFSNKSGEDIQINPMSDIAFSIDSTLQNTSQIITDDAEAMYLSAGHIYTSNGLIFNHTDLGDDKGENVNISQRKNIDISTDFTIPGYSVGYLSIPIQSDNDTGVPTAIKNKTDVNSLNLYPNPANSSISITFNHQILNSQNAKWELLDMSGKKHSVSSTFDSSHLKIDVSSLASGMYQVILSTDGKKYSSSFIKQ